jgi:hypothetical protein
VTSGVTGFPHSCHVPDHPIHDGGDDALDPMREAFRQPRITGVYGVGAMVGTKPVGVPSWSHKTKQDNEILGVRTIRATKEP